MPQLLDSEEKAAPSSESSKQRELVQFVVDQMCGANLLIATTIRDEVSHLQQCDLIDRLRKLQEINKQVMERVRKDA